MLNGPKIWDSLFKVIEPVYGSAIIAGGSPRDYYVNKRLKPRDIDIFVTAENEFDFELGMADLNNVFFQMKLLEPDNGQYTVSELQGSNVTAVIEGYHNDTGVKINIIGKRPEAMADPQVLLRDFDHSLCHFWVTPDDPSHVNRSDAAHLTLQTRRVTVYDKDGEEVPEMGQRTAARLSRLTSRQVYSDLVLPPVRKTSKIDFKKDRYKIYLDELN